MTTLICDFQSIVGEKIKGYATLTAGKVRPSYSSPAVVVHEPTKQEVTEGQTTFENVNPGDAVITVEWDDQTQSATIRFVVPESEEPIYLADCLSADSLDPDEIELLRWGIRENLSGAREMLETAKNLGLTEINGTVDAYFTEAAEILRKALEAAQLAEQSLGTIDDKVTATEGVVTDVDQAKQQIQALLDEIAALELELGGTNTDLAGAVDTINTLSPQVSAATQAASEATQKAQNAVNELNNVQTANAAEFSTIKQDLDTATQTAKQATDAVAQTNQQLGIEVQRILGEVDTALTTATEATAQARIANENLETYQYQLGEIQQEQGRILGQQAEIVGSFDHQLAEIERLSTEISTAATEIETISGEQSALVTEMNTQVGSLNELTAAQGAAINAAKSQADKGVTDAAAASNALTNYKKVNDPKVAAAQSTADTARAEATSKANAARIAAEGVAKELADKAQADAEVAAAAEALRIAQEEATAAKNAASADATAKANAAQTAAETLAKAQAKAAQEAAELTAALDASEKANKAKTDAEAKAATLATAAKDAAATALTGYKNLNDPKVTKAQSDATKGINAAAAAKSAANQAALDATNKALAAQGAAETYAREAAEAAQAQAEVNAAAEALRVAQAEATAAKNAAATDAQAKADEAERLAKVYAAAQAKTAKEQAEANAALDAATKAEDARIAAEANAKVLSDKAQQAAATAKARADKGVTDAATALAKANEANNKLPAITSDVSDAARVAAEAANALPGIRTDISTAKQQADKGVTDAGAAKSAADETARQLGTLTYPNNSLIPIDPSTGDPVWTGKFGKSAEGTWLVAGSPYNVPVETPHISVVKGQVYRAVVRLRANEPSKLFSIRIRGAGSGTSISPRYQSIPSADLPAGAIRKDWVGLSQYGVGTEWETWVCDFTLPETIEAVRVGYVYSGGGGHVEVSRMEIFPALPSKAEVSTAQSTADTARTEATNKANQALQDATTALTNYQKVNDPKVSTAQNTANTAKSAADTAQQRADKGVADAKAVNDKLPAITQAISGLQGVQVELGTKAQQGIDDAKVAADLVKNRVDVGTSLVGLSPGTTRPAWSVGMEPVPESENPLGLVDAYVSRAGQVGNHEYVTVSASDKVKYRVSFWLKASEPGSDLVFDARSPVPVPAGGNTLAFAGNEGVEGALNPGDTGRVFWVKDIPTEWTYYEGIKTPAPGLKHFYIGTRFWRHANGSNRTADQYVADLRIEPVIPSQDDVNKLLIDTAQNHTDILKAQGDINTAQGEINENNRVFQVWQKTINDQQAKWNKASSDATAALARFAITQSQWNDISSKATNANTKAIASHAALFEGQNKWNEVAAAAIETQAKFATKQLEWNAVQKKVNDNFQNWQNAATEMLTSTGKFQVLQTQFNTDQKKWNATQALVNDSQKGINALNTKTDEAQNQAIDANTRALNAITSNGTLIEYWQPTDAEIKANRLNPGANPLRWDRPVWTHGTRSRITATNDPDGFGLPAGQTEAWGVTSTQGNAVPPSVEAKLISDGKYLLSFWAKGSGGLVVYLYGKMGGESTHPVIRTRQVRVNQSTLKEVRDNNGARQYDGAGNGNNSASSGTQWLLNRFTFPAEWTYYLYEVEFKPGVSSVYFNTFYWNYGTTSTKGQYISGMEFRPDIPSQAQVDDAQNKAIEALNRFAINQSEWNTVSTTATNANTAALAAKKALDDNQNKWIQGADLAIANLQSTSTKYQQWTDGATTAIALNRELIGEQGLIQENQRLQMEALQEAVAEQTKLLYDELQSKPEIITVGDGQTYYDSRITVNQVKSGSQVSKVTVHANGTWTGIMHVEADHGKSEGPGSTFMNYTPLLRKVNLSYATSRDIVLTRNTSVDHIGKVRITYWVYPGEVLTTQKTGSWLIVEREQWLTLHSFTATDTATFNAELQVGWDAAGSGPEYGIRLTVNGTSVASDGPRKGVGPDFPWQDGYRQMSIKKTVVVQKGQTVKWEAYVSSGSSNERRIRNFNARATYMYRGLA